MSLKALVAFGAILSASVAGNHEGVFAGAADGASLPEAATDRRSPNKSPLVAEGVIERYMLDPRGEVEGLLLVDGSHMYVTSRAATQLLRALLPGDQVRVYGRRKPDERLVQADVIKNLSRGTTFTVPMRLDLPMQEQEHHLSVTEMNATGTIRILLSHPLKGIVQGMVLSDDTQIRLPPDTSEELRRSLHVGESVTVKGNGTKNRFGRAIEAVAIGRANAPLVPLDASIRSLP